MNILRTESEADIASTSTSDDVSAFDDSDDNARDEKKLTLPQRKTYKVLKTTREVSWSRP